MASSESRLQQQPSPKDAADQNFDYMFKLLIIGNSSVGKTSFLFRYADDSFTSAFVSTVGIDFKVKTVFRNDKRIKLQIWRQINHTLPPSSTTPLSSSPPSCRRRRTHSPPTQRIWRSTLTKRAEKT
uniref:small monomeric GTPase n=1 Tax=Sander lucioperca TaxID=283035 RepID=A0A8D0AI19_SANLU